MHTMILRDDVANGYGRAKIGLSRANLDLAPRASLLGLPLENRVTITKSVLSHAKIEFS